MKLVLVPNKLMTTTINVAWLYNGVCVCIKQIMFKSHDASPVRRSGTDELPRAWMSVRAVMINDNDSP